MQTEFNFTVPGIGSFAGRYPNAFDEAQIGVAELRLATEIANSISEEAAQAVTRKIEDCTSAELTLRSYIYEIAGQVSNLNHMIAVKPEEFPESFADIPPQLRKIIWQAYTTQLLSFLGSIRPLPATDGSAAGAQDEVLPGVAEAQAGPAAE